MSNENNVLEFARPPRITNRLCADDLNVIYLRQREIFIEVKAAAEAGLSASRKVPYRTWVDETAALVAMRTVEAKELNLQIAYWAEHDAVLSEETRESLRSVNANSDLMLSMLQTLTIQLSGAQATSFNPARAKSARKWRWVKAGALIAVYAAILYGLTKIPE